MNRTASESIYLSGRDVRKTVETSKKRLFAPYFTVKSFAAKILSPLVTTFITQINKHKHKLRPCD